MPPSGPLSVTRPSRSPNPATTGTASRRSRVAAAPQDESQAAAESADALQTPTPQAQQKPGANLQQTLKTAPRTPGAESPKTAHPQGMSAEDARRATSDMMSLLQGRAFELQVARAASFPGVGHLDHIDANRLREGVRDTLRNNPAPGKPEEISPLNQYLALRGAASAAALGHRLQVLALGDPELTQKARSCMRAAMALRKSVVAQWDPLMDTSGHQDAQALKRWPPPRRDAFARDLAAQTIGKIATQAPVATTSLADLESLWETTKLWHQATTLVDTAIEQVPGPQRINGVAMLRQNWKDNFVSHYSQSEDPAVRYPGNDGLCFGLSLQWARDGGRLCKGSDTSVGRERARRIDLLQRSTELTRRMVSVPGFTVRKTKLRNTVGEAGKPGPKMESGQRRIA